MIVIVIISILITFHLASTTVWAIKQLSSIILIIIIRYFITTSTLKCLFKTFSNTKAVLCLTDAADSDLAMAIHFPRIVQRYCKGEKLIHYITFCVCCKLIFFQYFGT